MSDSLMSHIIRENEDTAELIKLGDDYASKG